MDVKFKYSIPETNEIFHLDLGELKDCLADSDNDSVVDAIKYLIIDKLYSDFGSDLYNLLESVVQIAINPVSLGEVKTAIEFEQNQREEAIRRIRGILEDFNQEDVRDILENL